MSKKIAYAADPQLTHHILAPYHPESPQRFIAIQNHLKNSHIFANLTHIKAKPVSKSDLAAIHTAKHVESIQSSKVNQFAEMAVGLCLAAAEAVASGQSKYAFCNVRPPGHHSFSGGVHYDGANQGQGFCFYNNVAITARMLQKTHNVKKILIVDWDYHHGNGTESAFYSDDSVLFFSTHDLFAYPGTGDPFKRGKGKGEGLNINVPLKPGAGDEEVLDAFHQHLLPAVELFKPNFILISAGFDSRAGDPLGCFNFTDKGYRALTKLLISMADKYCPGKIVSILEGGYNPQGIASAVEAHLNTYAGLNSK